MGRGKLVSEKSAKKAMDQMKKKKSSGKDGISQECLLLGKEVNKIPLTRIKKKHINTQDDPGTNRGTRV